MNPLELADRMHQFGFAAPSEEVLHNAVQEFFRVQGIHAEPEWVLSAQERIDFYVPDGKIGVECKIDESEFKVASQLLRYAKSDQIDGLILVTSRHKHLRIPSTLNSKPLHVILTRAF